VQKGSVINTIKY